MNKCLVIFSFVFAFYGCLCVNKVVAQTKQPMPSDLGITNPWQENDLLHPEKLLKIINSGRQAYTIINIGAVDDIKGARHIGPVSKTENMVKLSTSVAGLEKNTLLVIYCGCCPFSKCPNIRPAFSTLKKAGFTQLRLLNLPTNLQTDWIAKRYPMAKN